jgi:threonine/homoserine/homoserine lactone efflux protein
VLDVLGDVIPFGVGVALSPFPIIAVLLLLTAPVGVAGGALFLLARAVGLVMLTALFAVLAEVIDTTAGSTLPAAILRVLLGGVLVVVAVRKFMKRPPGAAGGEVAESELPGWMRSIEGMSGAASMRLGFVLTVANPKEIAFAAGAGLTIGGAFLPVGQVVTVGAVFVVIACLSVATPVLAVAAAGERVAPALSGLRTWLVRNNSIVMSVVLLVIGAMVLGAGIADLAA